MHDLARFYHPNAAVGATVELSEDEARHAKVLRLNTGDKVYGLNGMGSLFEGIITMNKRRAELELMRLLHTEPLTNRSLILAVAPTKNINRFEWIVEKATEIGVSRIIPIACSQSERTHLKVDRLVKIAVSAMKQSKGLWVPELSTLSSFESLLVEKADTKWIAHCFEGGKETVDSLAKSEGSQLVAIGPEGDFTLDEIDQAKANNFREISLGSKRLRTETAAIVVCVSANLFHV